MEELVKTQNAQKRIEKIQTAVSAGIPVLLNGPTGTGKTFSARKVVPTDRFFSCSAETTVDQLLGKTIMDPNSENGLLKFKPGMYTDAYENGHALIIDEINLAPIEVLQCIEASLDSRFLIIDDSQNGNKKIPMHPNFKLIATQNPPTDEFMRNRNRLSEKFVSKFQQVNFDTFTIDELSEIATKLSQNKGIVTDDLKRLINFHSQCINYFKHKQNYRQFTIRDIKSTIFSVSKSIPLALSTIINYGSGFKKDERDNLLRMMKSTGFSIQSADLPKLNVKINHCIENPVLSNVLSLSNFLSIEQRRPIMLVGQPGCGKTTIGKWISQYLHSSKSHPRTIICTPETTNSDLIGRYTTQSFKGGEVGEIPIKWIDGPVVQAVQNGNVLLLDNIHNATSQVIERLNPLLDHAAELNQSFQVNEKPDNQLIKVDPNFRIIATASEDSLKKMSPALINRFALIYIDNQLPERTKQSDESLQQFIENEINQSGLHKSNINTLSEVRIYLGQSSLEEIVNLIFSYVRFKKAFVEVQPDYAYRFLRGVFLDHNVDIHPVLAKMILQKLPQTTQTFHFEQSDELKKLMAMLYAFYIIRKHVVMQSSTGYGKTSAAEAIAQIMRKTYNKVSFNCETQIGELFGNVTINDGQFGIKRGPLTSSMENGEIFIADELNLAEITVLQSLMIALENTGDEEIELPNIDETVKVSPNYFFIGCQNDISMFGRKRLPEEIERKVIMIQYPLLGANDIKAILNDIIKENSQDQSKLLQLITNVTELMIGLRDDPKLRSKPWSFREARRYFRRIIYFINNPKMSENFKPYHHAAFMLLSAHDESDKVVNSITDLIANVFNINQQDKEQLLKDLTENVVATDISDRTVKLTKGSLVLNVDRPLNSVSNQLYQFWNSYFNIMILHSQEPILLVGPSGYKEFIARNVSTLSKTVCLNRDSTTSSLIGTISLIDHNSLITSLFEILASMTQNIDLHNQINDIKTACTSGEQVEQKLLDVKEELIYADHSLEHVITQIVNNIINAIKKQENIASFLSDYTTTFRPGLITSAILSKRTLILKNFAHPTVSVMERLNEIFAIIPELTLNEDYTNTLVPPNNNKIVIKSSDFRVIATCSKDEKQKLSEAMLSRMTVVKTYAYEPEQYKYIFGTDQQVLANLITSVPGSFNDKMLIYNFCQKIISKTPQAKPDLIFKAAYNICSADKTDLIEKTESDFASPIIFKKDKWTASKTYKFGIPPVKEPERIRLVFTPSIKVLVESLFIASIYDQAIIIQGPNGTGKSEAINYVAQIHDANVFTVSLSKSTTVENLFGQNELTKTENGTVFDFQPTAFLNFITTHDDNDTRPRWVVLEELNLAPAPLLEALAPVFDLGNSSSSILLPNGESIRKGKYFIIGVATKPFFNDAIKKNAIIYNHPEYSDKEFDQICTKLAEPLNISDSAYVVNTLIEIRKYVQEYQIPVPITIRNFLNFIRLSHLLPDDINRIKKLTYLGPFIDPEYRKQIIKLFEIGDIDTDIRINHSYLSINEHEVPSSPKMSPECPALVKALSVDQKDAFVLLEACMRDTKGFPIIVQGPTASGKTHCIQLFADAVGADLTVIQMNADSNQSIVIGGYRPLSQIPENDRQEILAAVQRIPDEGQQIYHELRKLQKWTPTTLKSFHARLKEMKRLEKQQIVANDIDNAIQTILGACQFVNLIDKYESVLETAMKNGKWVLLDGIEAAPSEVFDRMISLLSERPTLNIYEHGSNKSIQAHEKFRLFMTYNPVEARAQSKISQTILSRCVLISLPSIDTTTMDSAIVLYGYISNSVFGNMKPQDIAIKVSIVHEQQKKSKFTENLIINGRTLVRIAQGIKATRGTIDGKALLTILKANYSQELNEIQQHVSEIYETFQLPVPEEYKSKFDKLTTKVSQELEIIMNMFDAFAKQHQININVFLNCFGRLTFDSYERLPDPISELELFNDDEETEIDDERLKQNLFAITVLNYIGEFILNNEDFITGINRKNEFSLDTIKVSEYPRLQEFSRMIDIIRKMINLPGFSPSVNINFCEVNEIINLYKSRTIQEVLQNLMRVKEISAEFFQTDTYLFNLTWLITSIIEEGYDVKVNADVIPENTIVITLNQQGVFFLSSPFGNIGNGSVALDEKEIFDYFNQIYAQVSEEEPIVYIPFDRVATSIKGLRAGNNENDDIHTIFSSIIFKQEHDISPLFTGIDLLTYNVISEITARKDAQVMHEFYDWINLVYKYLRELNVNNLEDLVKNFPIEKEESDYNSLNLFSMKQFHVKEFIEFQTLLQKKKLSPAQSKKTGGKSRKVDKRADKTDYFQIIMDHISQKNQNYTVMKWYIDNKYITALTPNDVLKKIYEDIRSQPTEYKSSVLQSFNELIVDQNSQEPVDWFINLMKYSYVTGLANQIREEVSYTALYQLCTLYPGFLEPTIGAVVENNTEFLLENLPKLEVEAIKAYYKDNVNTPQYLIKQTIVDLINAFQTNKTISPTWEIALSELTKKYPLGTVIEYPPSNKSAFMGMISLKYPALANVPGYTQYEQSVLTGIPPQKHSEISQKIKELAAQQPEDIQTIVKQIEELCEKLDDTISVSFDISDSEVDSKEFSKKFPFSKILLDKDPEIREYLAPVFESSSLTFGLILLRLYSNKNLLQISLPQNEFCSDIIKSALSQTLFAKEELSDFLFNLLSPTAKLIDGPFLLDCIIQVAVCRTDDSYTDLLKEFFSDFLVTMLQNFDKGMFDLILKSNEGLSFKEKNPSMELVHRIVWHPVKAFIDFCTQKLKEKADAKDQQNKHYEAEIKKIREEISNNTVSQLQQALYTDKVQFLKEHNKGKPSDPKLEELNKKIYSQWGKYSDTTLEFLNNIPSINDNPANKKRLGFNPLKFYEVFNTYGSPNLTDNAVKYNILLIQGDATNSFNVRNKRNGTSFTVPIAPKSPELYKIPDNEDPNDYAIENRPFEIFSVFISETAKVAIFNYGNNQYYGLDLKRIEAMINEFNNAQSNLNQYMSTKKPDEEVNNLQVKFSGMFSIDDCTNNLRSKDLDKVKSSLKTLSNDNPVVSLNKDYVLVNTKKLLETFPGILNNLEAAIANSHQAEDELNALKARIKNIPIYSSVSLPSKSEKTNLKISDVKLNGDLYSPAIFAEENKISANFKQIKVTIPKITNLQPRPLEIFIQSFSSSSAHKINLINSTKNANSIPTLNKSRTGEYCISIPVNKLSQVQNYVSTISSTLKLDDEEIPIEANISYKDPKVYIISPGNKFIWNASREKYEIKPSPIFTDNFTQIQTFNDHGELIPHSLTFSPLAETKQEKPPRAEYKKSISTFKLKEQYSMMLNIAFCNSMQANVYFNRPVFKRPVIAKFWDGFNQKFQDPEAGKIYVGNVWSKSIFVLGIIRNSDNDNIEISFTSSNPSIQFSEIVFDLSNNNPPLKKTITRIGSFKVLTTEPFKTVSEIVMHVKSDSFQKEYTFKTRAICSIPEIKIEDKKVKVVYPNSDLTTHSCPCRMCVYDEEKDQYIDYQRPIDVSDRAHYSVLNINSYCWASTYEPNIETIIDYSSRRRLPDSIQFSVIAFHITQGTYDVYDYNNVKDNTNYQIYFARLGPVNFDKDLKTQWQNAWFPWFGEAKAMREALNKVCTTLEKAKKSFLMFIQKFLTFIKAPPKYLTEITIYKDNKVNNDQLMNFISRIIQERLETIKNNFYHIKTPILYKDAYTMIKDIRTKYLKQYDLNNIQDIQQEIQSVYRNIMKHYSLEINSNTSSTTEEFDVLMLTERDINGLKQEEMDHQIEDLMKQVDKLEADYSPVDIDLDFSTFDYPSFQNKKDPASVIKTFETSIDLCKQYPLMALNWFQSHNSASLPERASNLLDVLYGFYKWATSQENLRYTPYKSHAELFAASFETLCKSLASAGLNGINSLVPNSRSKKLINMPGYDRPKIQQMPWKRAQVKKQVDIKVSTNVPKSIDVPKPKANNPFVEKGNKGKAIITKQTGPGQLISGETTVDEIQKWIIKQMENPDLLERLKFTKGKVGDFLKPVPMNLRNSELSVQPLIESANMLASQIVKYTIDNFDDLDKFSMTDAVLMLDTSFTIVQPNQRAALFVLFAAFAIALNNLHVPVSIMIFCDHEYHFVLKDFNEDLAPYHFQAALDAYSVFRKLSDLADAFKIAKSLNPAAGCNRRAVYTFSDGLFTKLHATEDWQMLLNKSELTFSLILLSMLPQKEFGIVQSYLTKFQESLSDAPSSINELIIIDPNLAFNDKEDKVCKAFIDGLNKYEDVIQKLHKATVERYETVEGVELRELSPVNDSIKDYVSSYTEDIYFNQYAQTSITIKDDDSFITRVDNGVSFHDIQLFKDIDSIRTRMPSVFEPNKPSQFSPSVKGSNISLKGFIQFYITQGQDQRIYLEKNTGHVPSYSLFIVIDASESCFGKVSFNHSMQTVLTTLYSIRSVDFESVTIIAATKDKLIEYCHEASVSDALSPSSDVYSAIYSTCANPSIKSDMAAALAAVYQIRSKQTTKAALCLCFTDGMVGHVDASDIGTMTSYLENRSTQIIGVGIGFYPKLISKVYRYAIWAPNPVVAPIALSKTLRGTFISKTEIVSQDVPKKTTEEIKEVVKLVEDINFKPVFADLVKFLNGIKRAKETYGAIYNPVSAAARSGTVTGQFVSFAPGGGGPDGQGTTTQQGPSIQVPGVAQKLEFTTANQLAFNDNDSNLDLGRGQNWKQAILICQFWDSCMLPLNTKGENKFITKSTLLSETGPIRALQELGMTCNIVQNYKDSIECLRSGEYSQAWIICGRGENRKPDELNKNGTSWMIDSFIECLIEFNKQGGSLLFSGDNNPLTYELNKFLERVELDGINPEFKFSLDEPGGNMLLFGDINSGNPALFDQRENIDVLGAVRPLYGYNVKGLYEGTTISCVPKTANIAPFRPFMISKNGNYANLYYMAPEESIAGDIIIDGSFTKFFNELHTAGTRRLVRNIAVWLLSVEKREILLRSNQKAMEWRANKFDFVIPIAPVNEVKFEEYVDGQHIDIALVVDGTGSMIKEANNNEQRYEVSDKSMIYGSKQILKKLMEYTKRKYFNLYVRYAAVFFRDEAKAQQKVSRGESRRILDTNVSTVFDFKEPKAGEHQSGVDPVKFNDVQSMGGAGDGPEDWVQAFTEMLDLSWKSNSKKIMIMITDNGGHGAEFNNQWKPESDDIILNEREGPKTRRLIQEIAQRQIDVCFISADRKALKGMEGFKKVYLEAGGPSFKNEEQKFGDETTEIKQALSSMIENVIDTAVASFGVGRVKEDVTPQGMGPIVQQGIAENRAQKTTMSQAFVRRTTSTSVTKNDKPAPKYHPPPPKAESTPVQIPTSKSNGIFDTDEPVPFQAKALKKRKSPYIQEIEHKQEPKPEPAPVVEERPAPVEEIPEPEPVVEEEPIVEEKPVIEEPAFRPKKTQQPQQEFVAAPPEFGGQEPQPPQVQPQPQVFTPQQTQVQTPQQQFQPQQSQQFNPQMQQMDLQQMQQMQQMQMQMQQAMLAQQYGMAGYGYMQPGMYGMYPGFGYNPYGMYMGFPQQSMQFVQNMQQQPQQNIQQQQYQNMQQQPQQQFQNMQQQQQNMQQQYMGYGQQMYYQQQMYQQQGYNQMPQQQQQPTPQQTFEQFANEDHRRRGRR